MLPLPNSNNEADITIAASVQVTAGKVAEKVVVIERSAMNIIDCGTASQVNANGTAQSGICLQQLRESRTVTAASAATK